MSSNARMTVQNVVMAGLDPAISLLLVTPTNVGVQL